MRLLLLISALSLQIPVYAGSNSVVEDSSKSNPITNSYLQPITDEVKADESSENKGILSSIYRFAYNHLQDNDDQIESIINAGVEVSGVETLVDNAASAPDRNRPNMRGLSAVPPQNAESSMDLAISTSKLQELNQAIMIIESGVDDLRSVLNGETGMLSTFVGDIGVTEESVTNMLQYMREDDRIGVDIKELITQLSDFKPIIEKAMQQVSKDSDFMSEELLSSRKLTKMFTADKEKEDKFSNTGKGSFSPPDEEEPFSMPGFDPFNNDPKHSRRFLEEILLKSGLDIDSDKVTSFFRREGGMNGVHSRHRFERKEHRVVDTATSDIASMDTCDKGCDGITNDKDRKQCNCNDLIKCVKQLKVNDFAVIFSRGLVDEESGEIEIETEVLQDGEIVFEQNSALNDIFDANELLKKIERVRAHILRSEPDCDAILDEFHVACKDWKNGCPKSSGRSYRMTINEICDSVNSPELITFESMSAAFDPETTIDETCDYLLPDEDMLLTEAKSKMTSEMDNTFSFINNNGLKQREKKTGWKELREGKEAQIAFDFEIDFDSTMKKTINNSFIKDCLEDESNCFPFKSQFSAKMRETRRRYREKDNGDIGSFQDLAFGLEKNIDDVSFVCNDDGESVTVTIPKTTWSATYDSTTYTKEMDTFTKTLPIACKAAFQDSVIQGFDNALSNIFNDYQDCITRGCDVDQKVGLQACQEMVDCTEGIWHAASPLKPAPESSEPVKILESAPESSEPVKILESAPEISEPVKTLEPAPGSSEPVKTLESAPETLMLEPYEEEKVVDEDKPRELFDAEIELAKTKDTEPEPEDIDAAPAPAPEDLLKALDTSTLTSAEDFLKGLDTSTEPVSLTGHFATVTTTGLLIPNPYPFAFSPRNIAHKKPATQSANLNDAQFAVDGDPVSTSRTSCGNNHWWEVDLGSKFPIHNVRFSRDSSFDCGCGKSFKSSLSIKFYDNQRQEILSAAVDQSYKYVKKFRDSSSGSSEWTEVYPNIIDEAIRAQFVRIELNGENSCLHLSEVEVNGYGTPSLESTIAVKDAPWDSKSANNKWDTIAWPRSWNAFPNDHGVIDLENPFNSALVFRDQEVVEAFEKVFSMQITGTSYEYSNTMSFNKPLACSIDVLDDDRCDKTRSLLFGKSTSVGQICSIADAIENDIDAMPGTCCLDNVHTLENFGERYECGKPCSKFAPFTLGVSEEACEQVRGTWCRKPCNRLKECIENKPSRDKCRVAASYEVGSEFQLTHSGNDCESVDDSIHLIISCKDENGMDCSRPTSMPTSMPSSMPSRTSSSAPSMVPSMSSMPSAMPATLQNSTSDSSMVEGFSSHSSEAASSTIFISDSSKSFGIEAGGEELLSPEPLCEDRTFTFTYNITYGAGGEGAAKIITNFIKGKDGIQTDLFQELSNRTELRYGESLVVEVTEELKLCSNGKAHKVLVALDMENSIFNEAFDDFSKDLIITDASKEEQCQQVREFLEYDPGYNDDNEVCRTFFDIKCDYDSGISFIPEKQTGGIIPGFQGFSFEPASFEGYSFETSEWVGFQFEGFDEAEDLSFQPVQEKELEKPAKLKHTLREMKAMRGSIKALEKAGEALKAAKKKIWAARCKIPFVVALGAGTNAPCKLYEGIKYFFVIAAILLVTAAGVTYVVLSSYYAEFVAVKDEDAWDGLFRTEAIYNNINTLNTALYSNLNTINTNMHNQHNEVRSTLGSQHEGMMELLSSQHTEIGSQLSEQHNSLGEQLTDQHTSLGEQLTDQHNSIGEQLTDQHTSLGTQLTTQHEIINENIQVQAEQINKIQETFNLMLQADFITSEFVSASSEFQASFLLRATNYGADCFVNVTRVEMVFKNETGLVNILSDESPNNVQPGRVGIQHITANFQVEGTGLSEPDDAIMYYITAMKEEMKDIAPVRPR